ncbi:hypothetical protein FSST1_013008 [Fusarium sambucinum]
MSTDSGRYKTTVTSFKALACVQCRHRKVKCNHSTPCARCIKAGINCTPSAPVPTRRRSKARKGLLERVNKCKELLTRCVARTSQSAIDFSDSHRQLGTMGPIVKSKGISGSQALDYLSPFREDDTPFLLSPVGAPYSSSTCRPSPVHVFRLWQIYLVRVDPLTKIVHVPTLQPYVTMAATDADCLPLNYQCLFYAVSLMAIVTLDKSECQELLGMPRGYLLQELMTHTRHALFQFDLFKNNDMTILQALVLFMISLQAHGDKQTAHILSDVVLCIAINMGYHRDGGFLNLTPFETEMRRRIWWQILLQNANLTGMGQITFQGVFDTKEPQNFNDVDLFPGSTRPIEPRDEPTEMGFVLIINRVMRFVMDSRQFIANNDTSHVIQRFLELDQALQEVERRYINVSAGSAHKLALAFRSVVSMDILKILDLSTKRHEQGHVIFKSEYTVPESTLVESDRVRYIYTRMNKYRFTWFARQYFQSHVNAILNLHLN